MQFTVSVIECNELVGRIIMSVGQDSQQLYFANLCLYKLPDIPSLYPHLQIFCACSHLLAYNYAIWHDSLSEGSIFRWRIPQLRGRKPWAKLSTFAIRTQATITHRGKRNYIIIWVEAQPIQEGRASWITDLRCGLTASHQYDDKQWNRQLVVDFRHRFRNFILA